MRKSAVPCTLLAVVFIASSGSALSGCGDFARLAGIEKSTKKTEQTTGELNQNTKGMKDSIDQVDGNTAAMRKELEDTKRKLEDANKRLDVTNAKLDGLNKGIDDTRDNTDALVSNTGDTYIDIRQGDTLAARTAHLAGVAREGVQEAKIAEAWKYFAAFEFQFWTGRGADTAEKRDALMAEGATEFLHDLERSLPPERKRGTSPLSEDAGMKNVYALATALDAYNGLQKDTGDRLPGFERMSMLDVIHRGLKAGAALRAGSRTMASLTLAERAVLEKEDVARYLLAVRQNFLPAIPLAALTDVDTRGLGQFLELLRIGFSRWNARLEAFGNVQLESFCAWLDKSLAEREFLQATPASAPAAALALLTNGGYDAQLGRALSNMNVTDAAVGSQHFLSERATLREAFRAKARSIAESR